MKSLLYFICFAICVLATIETIVLVVIHFNHLTFNELEMPLIGLVSLIWSSCSLFQLWRRRVNEQPSRLA
jgi:hypothetical protein